MLQFTDFTNPSLRFIGQVIAESNKEYLATRAHNRKWLKLQNTPSLVPDFDEEVAEFFRDFRPSFEVEGRTVKAKLYKIEPSKLNGEMVAYYDLATVNSATGAREITTFIFGFREGEVTELKRFPPRLAR